MEKRYRRLTEFLKEKFGERTLKICIDGGFSCPNRDGNVSLGGCIFCSEKGSGEHLKSNLDITNQVKNYFNSYKAERANKFIAYFQNFTNTYADCKSLKEKYDAALIDDRIVALAVATRPDCIDEEKVKLLKEYSKKYYVWVEFGFQTSNENTAKFINRGYDNEVFINAVKLLNKYEIDVVTHVMCGLPGETKEDVQNTIKFLNTQNIQGLKIHSTYVVKNTILEKLYNDGKYIPIELEEYIDEVIWILTHVSKDIVIHRISGDAPKDLLVAPSWNLHKKLVLNGVDKVMESNRYVQGEFLNS